MNFYCKSLLAISMFLMPFLVQAQFGYIGAGIGFRTTKLYKADFDNEETTKHVSISPEISGIYRPFRLLSLGATLGYPIHETSWYTLAEATRNSDYSFRGFGQSQMKEFMPKKFGYTYEQSLALTFKARFYALPKAGGYLDFRLTMMSLTENFFIERDSSKPHIRENYAYAEKVNLIIPGFGFGFHHHLRKHLYVDLSANFDFMNIQNNGFSHSVSYKGSSSEYQYVTFKDQMGGKSTSFVMQLSFGYIF